MCVAACWCTEICTINGCDYIQAIAFDVHSYESDAHNIHIMFHVRSPKQGTSKL